MKVVRLWTRVLKIGYHPDLPDNDKKRLMMINGLSLVNLAFIIFSIPVYLMTGLATWYLVLLTVPVYFGLLLLNHAGRYSLARYSFFWSFYILVTVFAFINRRTGTEYGLLALGFSAGLLFERKTEVILFFGLTLVSLGAYEVYDYDTPFIGDASIPYLAVRLLSIVFSGGMVIFQVTLFNDVRIHYSRKQNERYDVTQRILHEKNEAENKLKEANEKLHMLNDQLDWIVKQKDQELQTYLDGINVHIYSAVTDMRGNFIRVNKPLEEASGYAACELAGHNLSMLCADLYPQQYFQDIWSTVATGNTWRGEINNRARDGSFFWTDLAIIPIRSMEEKIDYFLLLGLPITERKEMEGERERTNRMLEIIAFQTSHRIRRPITSILGLANLVEKDLITSEELRLISNKFNECAVELDEATKDLTTYVNNNNY
jgi:PAS domain S-box-containing protein